MKSSAFFFFPAGADEAMASAEMTLPSVVSDLLMFAPSFRRWPVAPVELARSEPAKSIKLSFRLAFSFPHSSARGRTHLIRDTFSVSRFVSLSCLFIVSSSVNTACDRELVSFMFVAATVRALLPSSIRFIISSYPFTTSLDRSSTYGPREGCSRTRRLPVFFGLRRSRTWCGSG
jgi:hypothetical protein